jgi:hypothetical protein
MPSRPAAKAEFILRICGTAEAVPYKDLIFAGLAFMRAALACLFEIQLSLQVLHSHSA